MGQKHDPTDDYRVVLGFLMLEVQFQAENFYVERLKKLVQRYETCNCERIVEK